MGELLTSTDAPLTVAIGERAQELLDRLFAISLEPGERTVDQIRAIEALFKISREERMVALREAEVARKFASTAIEAAEQTEAQRERAKAVLEKLMQTGKLPEAAIEAYKKAAAE